MAQGKKTDEQTLEVARAYLTAGETVAAVSRRLKIPESTVRGWRRRFEREDKAAEAEKTACEGGECAGGGCSSTASGFAELRAQKKREMIERAWRIIEKAQGRVERELDRAIEQEREIENAITLLGTMGDLLSPDEKKRCFRVLSEMRMNDVSKLSSVIGVMYDKQALANKEETEILGGTVAVRRFEDL